jgi:hypothetical protein
MSSLLQARERWVIIKLLSRLEQNDDDTGIWHRVLKMHGYQILGAVLKEWHTESNIVVTVTYPPFISVLEFVDCGLCSLGFAYSVEIATGDEE